MAPKIQLRFLFFNYVLKNILKTADFWVETKNWGWGR